MGKRSRQRKRSVMGDKCAFVREGCTNHPAYSLIGPFVVPERLVKANPAAKQDRIPVMLAFVCEDCMPRAMEWMPEAEITPFDEVPPSMMPMLMQHVFGGQLPEVQFVA